MSSPAAKDFGSPFAQLTQNLIVLHIYLGSVEATTKPTLRSLNIAAVLSIGAHPLYVSKKIDCLLINCGDSLNDVIATHFERTICFIEEHVEQEHNVLVHPLRAPSRAPSFAGTRSSP